MRYTKYIPAMFAAASVLAFVTIGRAAPTTAPSGTATITGTLKDMAGKAAAHVTVTLSIAAPASQPAATADAPAGGTQKQPHHKMTVVAHTTTDDDGNFKFESIAAGDYTINARQKGLGSATVHLSIKDGEAKDVQLTLAKRGAAGTPAKPTN